LLSLRCTEWYAELAEVPVEVSKQPWYDMMTLLTLPGVAEPVEATLVRYDDPTNLACGC